MKKLTKGLTILSLVSLFALSLPAYTYAQEATSTPTPQQGILKKVFGTTGKAAIGSGIVESKSTSSLVVTKDGKTYTVNITDNTKFRRRFWGKSGLDEIQVGDTVNVIGRWTDDTKTAINAIIIRDLSIQKRYGVFFGTVSSKTGDGWVMTTVERGNQTVIINSSTKLVNRKGEVITSSDVKVGDKVRVKGLWNKNSSTITEVTHVKDFNIPAN